MAYDELRALAREYPTQEPDALRELTGEYNRRYEREILDLAATAADVSVDDVTTAGLEPETNSQLAETLDRLGYSDDSFASLQNVGGHISRVKGTYFEVLVRDKLNAHESVGDIALLPGQKAQLAESLTEEAWDIRIVNDNGTVAEQIQLKASESFSYIKKALDKHPDIRVIAPQELEERAENLDQLTTSDITDASMESEVGKQLAELSEDTLTDIAHQSIEAGLDAVPVFSIAVIGATEIGQLIMGRSTVEKSLKRGVARLGRSSIYTSIGAALSAVDAGIISVPTVTALRVAEGRVRHRAAMGDYLDEKTQEVLRQRQIAQEP